MNKKSVSILALFTAILIAPSIVSAQPEGSLAMKLYVIETTGVPERISETRSFLPAHLEHQVDLERRGIMFGAGPLSEEGAAGGPPTSGMIIIRAESFEEARAIADADPMHANGIRTYTIRQWSLNEGTINVRVNFSDQSVEFN